MRISDWSSDVCSSDLVFDDFHAAALALFDSHWTDRAHLGILGGSNGGLLMGTQIVQHPADYRAVVARVGIYDMLRPETDRSEERRVGNECCSTCKSRCTPYT